MKCCAWFFVTAETAANARRLFWFALELKIAFAAVSGAGEGIRTPDPLITNQMLYRLSYASAANPTSIAEILERETGIEPATNSLEGCDSTIELLPLSFLSAMIAIPAAQ